MTLLRLAAAWSATLLAATLAAAAEAPAPQVVPARPPALLALSPAPEEGPHPAWHRAVETSLVAAAQGTGTVLCLDGLASENGLDLDQLCAKPDPPLPRLLWTARADQTGSGRLRIVVELSADGGAPAGPAQLLLILQSVAGIGAESLDQAAAAEIEATLPTLPDLQRWLGSLGRTALVHPRPGGEKTAAAPPPPATPPAPASTAPPVAALRPRVEMKGSGEKPVPPRVEESSFAVREGLVGGGFHAGVAGSLRIRPAGIAFLRGEREEWSIRWENLVEASKDEGYWDSPYPLLLTEKGGKRRYVTRIDERGRYLPGEPLLAAIARGRRSRGGKVPNAAGETTGEPQSSRGRKDEQLEQGDIP